MRFNRRRILESAVSAGVIASINNVAAASSTLESEDETEVSQEYKLRIEELSQNEYTKIVTSSAINKKELLNRMGKIAYDSLRSTEQQIIDELIDKETLKLEENPNQVL